MEVDEKDIVRTAFFIMWKQWDIEDGFRIDDCPHTFRIAINNIKGEIDCAKVQIDDEGIQSETSGNHITDVSGASWIRRERNEDSS